MRSGPLRQLGARLLDRKATAEFDTKGDEMRLTLFKPQWVLDLEQSILELNQYIATIKERDRQFYAGELPLPGQGTNSINIPDTGGCDIKAKP